MKGQVSGCETSFGTAQAGRQPSHNQDREQRG